MAELDIRSHLIKNTIINFSDYLRAENIDHAIDSYAAKDTISKVNNINNQVVFGRRGTGKTHLMLALRESLIKSFNKNRRLPIYIDLRKIKPLINENLENQLLYALIAFQHTIVETFLIIYENIKFVYDLPIENNSSLIEKFKQQEINEIYAEFNLGFKGDQIEKLGPVEFTSKEVASLKASLNLSKDPSANFGAEASVNQEKKTANEKFISLTNITESLNKLLDLLDVKLMLLIDEWSEIPNTIQPFLAELFKRVFIPCKISFKICAIPYRTKLLRRGENENIGLEEGGDIFPFNLDNRYVFEINKTATRDFYNELLFNHFRVISPAILSGYSKTDISIIKKNFINQFLANQALSEALIASGGIPRDFCNLLVNAYDKFLLLKASTNKRIVVKNIRDATTEWYSTDKKEHVENNPNLKLFLALIIEEVLLKKKKTHFLIPQKYESLDALQSLLDLRVIHLRKKGYSHQDIKSVTYNVYSLDYGSYTSLNIAKGNIDTDFVDSIEMIEDFRDVRRIALDDNFFGRFNLESGSGIKCKFCGNIIDTNHPAYVKQNLCNHCFEKI